MIDQGDGNQVADMPIHVGRRKVVVIHRDDVAVIRSIIRGGVSARLIDATKENSQNCSAD